MYVYVYRSVYVHMYMYISILFVVYIINYTLPFLLFDIIFRLIKMTFISSRGQYPYKPSFSLTPLLVLIIDVLNWNCNLICFVFLNAIKKLID